MKRLAVLFIAPLALLAACGGDDAPRSTDPTRVRTTGWQTIADPLNQREFRCYYASTGYSDGGIALWCYELVDTPPTTG